MTQLQSEFFYFYAEESFPSLVVVHFSEHHEEAGALLPRAEVADSDALFVECLHECSSPEHTRLSVREDSVQIWGCPPLLPCNPLLITSLGAGRIPVLRCLEWCSWELCECCWVYVLRCLGLWLTLSKFVAS